MELKEEIVIKEEIVKKCKGRPKGTFKENKTIDKDYYNKYYHKTCGDVICECGLKTNKRNLARHMKTKKHLEILELRKDF